MIPVSTEKKRLLDAGRAQNIEIVLGKLRTSYPKIANALITCDEKVIFFF